MCIKKFQPKIIVLKMKKRKKCHEFSNSKNLANFEAFHTEKIC